ncbi:MAG: hypothetical protein ACRD9Q_02195 [Nitrososphaeraceae archaeon]
MTENKYYDLALKWAPVDYQYIKLGDASPYLNKTHNYPDGKGKEFFNIKQDLLCQVDFATSYNDLERWNTKEVKKRLENVAFADLIPTAYYSIAETEKHYFILYSFYHAYDRDHPNDMEGCLIILEKKDNQELLLGMITIAHYDFWYYTYKENLTVKKGITTKGRLEIDEEFDGHGHPLIQQEEEKHGLYALGIDIAWFTEIWWGILRVCNRLPDIIVYYPHETKASKYSLENLIKGKKSPYDPSFYYVLVDILDKERGLWERWNKREQRRTDHTFDEFGKFYGGAANPPWLWRPSDVKSFKESFIARIKKFLHMKTKKNESKEITQIWNDPQKLVSENFIHRKGFAEFNSKYIRHMDGSLPVE